MILYYNCNKPYLPAAAPVKKNARKIFGQKAQQKAMPEVCAQGDNQNQANKSKGPE